MKHTETATLTFPSRALAKAFATAWTLHTATGHDMSAGDAPLVTVYGVDSERKLWIDSYVSSLNATLNA